MSKATEWKDFANDKKRPTFSSVSIRARVLDDGRCDLATQDQALVVLRDAKEAVKLARWITDTYEEPKTEPTVEVLPPAPKVEEVKRVVEHEHQPDDEEPQA